MRIFPIGGGARLHLKPLSLGHYGKFFVSGQRYKLIFKYKTIAQCLRLRSTRKAAFTLAEVFLPYYLSPRRIAFTLAEVLITLGIIGVVAAMTLPTLIANYQKQVTLAKLKKAYSVLSQVLERNYYDHGDIGSFVGTGSEVTEQKTRDFFNTYWLPYFDSPEISKEGTFPYGKSVPFRGFDNTTFTTSVTTSYADGRIALTTKDGISYYIFTLRWVDVTDENGNVIDRKMTYADNMQVFVDVDGTKGENKMGKDVFIFQIDTTKNKVNPYGHNLSSSVLERNCPNGNGSYCSARILKEGWKISYF